MSTWADVTAGDHVRVRGVIYKVTRRNGPDTTLQAPDGTEQTGRPDPSKAVEVVDMFADALSPAAREELAVALVQVRLGGSLVAVRPESGPHRCPAEPDGAHLYLYHDGEDHSSPSAIEHMHVTDPMRGN